MHVYCEDDTVSTKAWATNNQTAVPILLKILGSRSLSPDLDTYSVGKLLKFHNPGSIPCLMRRHADSMVLSGRHRFKAVRFLSATVSMEVLGPICCVEMKNCVAWLRISE